MIEKLGHYSFESLPSVYDEEALTALELCGRLGAKMNDVISHFNTLSKQVEGAVEYMTKSLGETAEKIVSGLIADGKINVTLSYIEDTQALNLVATNAGVSPGALYYAENEYLDIL